eukprot:TRINITY_DN1208_c0_g1_i2.p1 TRINITY_DN1208_c0_g1~~TRINITY_DN1208_c0_g1_i2.p1  ORF type:complete len:549 (-),score=100.28 TRINITY_DN1208_c0_g1_i2:42-1688(-)
MSISQAPVVFVAKPTALLDSEPKSDRPARSQSRWASQLDDLFFTGIDSTVVQEQKKRLNIDDKLFHPEELPKTSPRGPASSSSSAGAPDASATVTASATTAIALAISPAKVEALTRHPSPRRQSTPVPAVAVTSVMPTTPAIVAPVIKTPEITPPHSRTPSPQPQIQITGPSPQVGRLALPSDSISLSSNAPMTAPALQVNASGPVRGHVRAVSGGHTSSAASSTSSSTTSSAASSPGHTRSPSTGSASTSSSAGHSRQPSGDRRKSLVNVQPLQRRNPAELHAINLWLKAAASGNIVEMKKLMQTQSQYVNVNSINEEGQTALGVAVAAKQVDIVKALLQVSTLDPNIKDLVGHTPLHVAAKSGRQRDPDGDSEKMVLTRDLNILNGQWIPPIDKENEEEDKVVEIIRLLCADKRVDVNAKDYFFCSALVLACAVGNLRVVYTLVKSGAAVNTNTATLVTPLHTACEKGYKEIVKLLVSRGAKVDVKDKDGYTPLHLAAQKSFVVICKILKRAGADVYAQTNTTYKTPVDLATSEQLKNYLLGSSDS